MKTLNVIATSLLLLATAAPIALAHAADSAAASKAVFYGDLNLEGPDGIETLYARLRSAAAKVCEAAEFNALDRHLRRRNCIAKALSRAVDAIDVPALREHHVAKTGVKAPSLPQFGWTDLPMVFPVIEVRDTLVARR